jgi:hypothetical protein
VSYQQGMITLYNPTSEVQYVGGYTIAAGQTAQIPLNAAMTDTTFLSKVVSQTLLIVGYPQYDWIDWPEAPYPAAYAWLPPTQLGSPNPYPVPPINLTFAKHARLFVNPGGSPLTVQLAITHTPTVTGGIPTTWYPLTDWMPSGTATISQPTQWPLPPGIPLLQAVLTYSGTPTVSMTVTFQ